MDLLFANRYCGRNCGNWYEVKKGGVMVWLGAVMVLGMVLVVVRLHANGNGWWAIGTWMVQSLVTSGTVAYAYGSDWRGSSEWYALGFLIIIAGEYIAWKAVTSWGNRLGLGNT